LLERAFPIFDIYNHICSIVPELRETTNELNTPLYYAAQEGILDAVRTLLNKGADVNKINNQGATPLYLAPENGHKNIDET
jgi:ankyrin repeat protein